MKQFFLILSLLAVFCSGPATAIVLKPFGIPIGQEIDAKKFTITMSKIGPQDVWYNLIPPQPSRYFSAYSAVTSNDDLTISMVTAIANPGIKIDGFNNIVRELEERYHNASVQVGKDRFWMYNKTGQLKGKAAQRFTEQFIAQDINFLSGADQLIHLKYDETHLLASITFIDLSLIRQVIKKMKK